MAFAALGGFFHYIGIGPDETDDEDEDKAAKLARELRTTPAQRDETLRQQGEKAP
jgi:hypothetical protein